MGPKLQSQAPRMRAIPCVATPPTKSFKEASTHEATKLARSFMTHANAALLESGNHSDLVLECDGQEFKVHRAIICPRSDVLASMCSSVWEEGKTGRVQLAAPTATPGSVKGMLQYLYTGEYDADLRPINQTPLGKLLAKPLEPEHTINIDCSDSEYDDAANSASSMSTAGLEEGEETGLTRAKECGAERKGLLAERKEHVCPNHRTSTCDTVTSENDMIINHVRVYALGDYYQIRDLQHYALLQFRNRLWRYDQCGFEYVIEEVYENTHENAPLRDVVVKHVAKCNRFLMGKKNHHFIDSVAHRTDFMKSLVMSLIEEFGEPLESDSTASENDNAILSDDPDTNMDESGKEDDSADDSWKSSKSSKEEGDEDDE